MVKFMRTNNVVLIQKQPFADVLQNRSYQKFRNIQRKAPVLESLFNKVVGLRLVTLLKKRLQHRCFPVKIAKFLRTTFFIELLRWLLLLIALIILNIEVLQERLHTPSNLYLIEHHQYN